MVLEHYHAEGFCAAAEELPRSAHRRDARRFRQAIALAASVPAAKSTMSATTVGSTLSPVAARSVALDEEGRESGVGGVGSDAGAITGTPLAARNSGLAAAPFLTATTPVVAL
ncbi:hypothetical protein [Enteroscipio rubneri]|uniref:hypothetical protein n=2 Tax=Enteroscipio rubneri TaxID=2070686 RepID=UPI003AB376D4